MGAEKFIYFLKEVSTLEGYSEVVKVYPDKRFLKISIVLFLVLLFVSGCIGQPPKTPTPTPTPTRTPKPKPSPKPTKPPKTKPPKPTRTPKPPKPSPIETPTPTPTPSPTQMPPANFANFKTGSYSKYLVEIYAPQKTQYYMTYKVIGESERNGVPVWVLQMIMEQEMQGVKMKTIYTWELKKDTFNLVWWKLEVYRDSQLVMTQEGGPSEKPRGASSPSPPKAEYSVGTETITVPAGTFTCSKFQVTVTSQGKTAKTTSWHSSDVPVFGLVKSITYVENQKTMETILIEYKA